MRLQEIARRVFPKEESFYSLLERLGALANLSVSEFRALGANGGSTEAVAARVQEVEHEADRVFHEVETRLARTFVTPIDREDIHEIAFEIDEIVDMVNLSARTCALYHIERLTPAMVELAGTLERCTRTLAAALPRLRRHDYAGLLDAGRTLRGLEKEADTIFRQTLSALYQDPAVDAKRLLKEKEIIEHIEDAVDRCDRLGNTLCNLAVKHG